MDFRNGEIMITCYFENGNEANLRHVCVDALIIRRGKILLVKRSKGAAKYPNKYALPGGFLDRDENTKEGVLREVLEETGYKGKAEKLFEIIDKPNRCDDTRQNVGFVYVVSVFGKRGKEDKKETAEVAWFDLNKLPENIGFDHLEIIKLYLKMKRASHVSPLQLPIITS